jgi:hypothetical protein
MLLECVHALRASVCAILNSIFLGGIDEVYANLVGMDLGSR